MFLIRKFYLYSGAKKKKKQFLGCTLEAFSCFFKQVLFIYFCLFRAAPEAYGSSQAKGPSELQLLAYATATPDPSRVCDLHHSSWQPQILNPLSEARGRTCVLMDTGPIHFCYTMTGTPGRNFRMKWNVKLTPKGSERQSLS